jgi:hypothetical protein
MSNGVMKEVELVGLLHLYLVVTRIGIRETQELAPCSRVYDLIDSCQRKGNFGHALFVPV